MKLDIEGKMPNFSSISEFLLLEFSEVRELQILYFFVFLILYLTTVTGNLLIIIVITLDHHLHTPMYFFLTNLAMLDVIAGSVIIPKSLVNSLLDSRSISYSGCIAQVFLIFFLEGSDFAILTIMAYDRYVAICDPLRYDLIMHKGACIWMVVTAWAMSLLNATIHTGGTFAFAFCSNIVNQFFCEIPQLLRLSCFDLNLIEICVIVFSCTICLGCFIFIILTYVKIFGTVLSLPSVKSQKKALSTCFPHLIVISLFLFTGIFAYVKPPTNTSSDLNIVSAVLYATIPPMLNPYIYSVRNKEIKAALWKHFEHFLKIISSRGVLCINFRL